MRPAESASSRPSMRFSVSASRRRLRERRPTPILTISSTTTLSSTCSEWTLSTRMCPTRQEPSSTSAALAFATDQNPTQIVTPLLKGAQRSTATPPPSARTTSNPAQRSSGITKKLASMSALPPQYCQQTTSSRHRLIFQSFHPSVQRRAGNVTPACLAATRTTKRSTRGRAAPRSCTVRSRSCSKNSPHRRVRRASCLRTTCGRCGSTPSIHRTSQLAPRGAASMYRTLLLQAARAASSKSLPPSRLG